MRKRIEDLVEEYSSNLIITVDGKRVFFPISVDVEGGVVECFSPKAPPIDFNETSAVIKKEDIDNAKPVENEIFLLKGAIEIHKVP